MKVLLLTAAGVLAVGGVGSAMAMPGSVGSAKGADTAVAGPVLGAAGSAVGIGSGTGPAVAAGAVGTALAPVSQQSPEAGAAVASTTAQATAAISQGGAQAAQGLQTAHEQSKALAPIVNPVVHPILDAVAAQAQRYEDIPGNAAVSGYASYLADTARFLTGTSE
jgi:hypothetical protein